MTGRSRIDGTAVQWDSLTGHEHQLQLPNLAVIATTNDCKCCEVLNESLLL